MNRLADGPLPITDFAPITVAGHQANSGPSLIGDAGQGKNFVGMAIEFVQRILLGDVPDAHGVIARRGHQLTFRKKHQSGDERVISIGSRAQHATGLAGLHIPDRDESIDVPGGKSCPIG